MIRASLLTLALAAAIAPPAAAVPAIYAERKAAGLDVGVVTVDLADPNTQVELLTPRPEEKEFWSMVGRAHAAAVIDAPPLGVSAGRAGKPAPTGTSFGLLPGNVAQLATARWDPPVDWPRAWTAVTGGPRLLRDGKPWLHPEVEPQAKVAAAQPRSALGLSRDGKQLLLVTFPTPVTLVQAAGAMQALGAWQAMNLTSGPTRALAVEGEVLADPGHATKAGNVLAVYDARHPVPRDLQLSYLDFGRPGLAPLAAGKKLVYAGMAFSPVSNTPIVSAANDILGFGARSFGQIFAPWRKPLERYVLNFDARVVDEGWTCFFDGDNQDGKLVGASLECRLADPPGLYLRQDGKVVGASKDAPLDHAWHRYHCQVDPDEIKIYGEDTKKPLITAPRGTPGTGLGFAGRGEFRRFTLKQSD